MVFSSHLFLRVEPTMPPAVKAAARAQGIGRSEFIRRAIIEALGGDGFVVGNRKPRRATARRPRVAHAVERGPECEPPPPCAPAAAMRAAA